jgi:hypothetical protein
LAALHSTAINKTRGDQKFVAFKMPNDFDRLVHFISVSRYESLTLVGSFRSWSDDSKGDDIQDYLISVFKYSKLPRVWNICFDLHHDLNDLLYGNKTQLPNLHHSKNLLNEPLNQYFDMIAWGYEYLNREHELPEFLGVSGEERLIWTQRHKQALSTYDAITSQIHNRMDFFHVVSQSEIPWIVHLIKRLKVIKASSLGAPYPTRMFIRRFISQSFRSNTVASILISILNFLEKLINKFVRFLTRKSYNNLTVKSYVRFFKQTVISSLSAYSWVDGSSLNYPVRKYLEMPLCNSILVSPPSSTIEAMGFIDKESILFVELSENTDQLNRVLKLSGRERRRLYFNAREVVRRLHTPDVRLDQLRFFIENFESGQIVSASIHQGQFSVNRCRRVYDPSKKSQFD